MVLCVLIPLIALSVFTVMQLIPLTNTIGTQGKESIKAEGLISLQNTSIDTSEWVENQFAQVEIDLARLVEYEKALMNGSINVSETRPSYHQDDSVAVTYNSSYGLGINITISDFINTTSRTVQVNDTINKSTYMDYICRGIFGNNPAYVSIIMAFDVGISRIFPFIDASRSTDLSTAQWYTDAVAGSPTEITAGYPHDAYSMDSIFIARQVRLTNGTLVGVIAMEVKLSVFRQHINAIKVQETGYAGLVDQSAQCNALAHPLLGLSLTDTLPNLEGAPLTGVIPEISTNQTGIQNFTKSGDEWVIAFAPAGGTNYTVVTIVKVSEIVAPGNTLQQNLAKMNLPSMILLIACAITLVILVYFLVISYSKRITRPITSLTRSIENMTRGDLSKEIPLDPRHKGDELGVLARSFQNLLVTMRLGNQSYYRGDLAVAFSNYNAALELFKTTENKRGQAMCYNNLGNIYRQWGDYERAKESYDNAIAIGEGMEDKAGLSARYNNRGLLLLSEGEWDDAKDDFLKALDIDEEYGDEESIAMRKRNLGVMYMLKGTPKSARRYLEESFKLNTELDSESGLAEDNFQLGRLMRLTKDLDAAEDYFKTALNLAQKLENYPLMKHVLEEMIKLYEETDSVALLHKAEEQLSKVNEVLIRKKEIVFVIDQSGSMQEHGKMNAARKGAVEVFEEAVNVGDNIAVLGFHSILNRLLEFTEKRGSKIRKIHKTLEDIEVTPYQTAFYDAVGEALKMIQNVPKNHQRWIVALTDGQDNMSQLYDPDLLAGMIKDMSPPINFILIGVGSELKLVHKEMTQIVEASPRGKYIKIYSVKNVREKIEEAFMRVKEIMASSEIEGFTPERS
ncbi:MAG: tetratricopeptide repeat protein [Promethearchaeota archaeon]